MATSSPPPDDVETATRNDETTTAHDETSSLLAEPQNKGDTDYATTDPLSSRQDETPNNNDSNDSVKFYPPRRNCCHLLFVFVSLYALAASACMAITQLLPPSGSHNLGILHLILRIYMFLVCVIFCLTELEVPFVVTHNGLSNWIVRGFVYSFVGLVGVEESLSALPANQKYEPSVKGQTVSFFIWLTSAALFISGFLYLLLGILLMKQLRDKIRQDYNHKVQTMRSVWTSKTNNDELS